MERAAKIKMFIEFGKKIQMDLGGFENAKPYAGRLLIILQDQQMDKFFEGVLRLLCHPNIKCNFGEEILEMKDDKELALAFVGGLVGELEDNE